MRKEKIVPITMEGRDKGKLFKITEMSAWEVDRWGRRALLMLAHAGIDVGEVNPAEGLAGIIRAGVQNLNKLDEPTLGPLMDEMLKCISYVPDPKTPQFTTPLKEEDIEESVTILELRAEVMNLHVGFSSAAPQSTSHSSMQEAATPTTRITRTRPARSGPLSRQSSRS